MNKRYRYIYIVILLILNLPSLTARAQTLGSESPRQAPADLSTIDGTRDFLFPGGNPQVGFPQNVTHHAHIMNCSNALRHALLIGDKGGITITNPETIGTETNGAMTAVFLPTAPRLFINRIESNFNHCWVVPLSAAHYSPPSSSSPNQATSANGHYFNYHIGLSRSGGGRAAICIDFNRRDRRNPTDPAGAQSGIDALHFRTLSRNYGSEEPCVPGNYNWIDQNSNGGMRCNPAAKNIYLYELGRSFLLARDDVEERVRLGDHQSYCSRKQLIQSRCGGLIADTCRHSIFNESNRRWFQTTICNPLRAMNTRLEQCPTTATEGENNNTGQNSATQSVR